jgi:glyoxylase-like metal-dependent hydrolase (beta-lactamase superfamily II)
VKIGSWDVRVLETGRFRLDGGAMFGTVPKVLWEADDPADDKNRIELALRCLFLEGHGRRVLVDTGLGEKWDEKAVGMYSIGAGNVRSSLRAIGVEPETISDVILTHLHFDHAGGATHKSEDGVLVPSFPNARFYLQRRNLEWARKPNDRERASYRPENFEPLDDADVLELLDGSSDVLPDISVATSDGHTEGLQMVRIRGGGEELWYTADLIPTAAHVHAPWIAAYDLSAIRSLEEKRALLDGIAGRPAWLVYEHDRRFAASKVVRDGGRFRAAETRSDL